MKNILIVSLSLALAAVSAQAQDTIQFNNTSTTKITTNMVAGGTATGVISIVGYRFALYCSTNASTVSGQTVAFAGTAGDYAFNDPNWRLVAYGTNIFPAGQFVSVSANSSGATTVPGVTSGSATRFVVIGWSGNAGANVGALEAWFNGGSPASAGWIGQSDVSGAITLGGTTTPATLFASNSPPAINGFTLGLVGTSSPMPPEITSQPVDQTVQSGNNAQFSVGATGTSLAYQWFFNSNAIAGATSSSLTIFDAQSTNAGYYSVSITNSVGSTNSFGASLTVTSPSSNTPPVITSQPANQTVAQGGTTEFSVSATGNSLAYQWFFNSSNRLAGATSPTLIVVNAQSTNAGNYSVAISNSAGSTNSANASLTVTPATNTDTGGYVVFANSAASATKIYTNSAVGGAATGLTASSADLYYYALYVSSNAVSGGGQTAAIVGSASTNYAFNDTNWTLVAYGVNVTTNGLFGYTNNYLSGEFMSLAADYAGRTPVPGFNSGTSVQFVVIGWSANVATTNIESVESWFNGGSPASNGWIGQSAVSGSLELGNGTTIQTPQLFGTAAPHLQGFTLGLASPVPSAAYPVPYAPPAIVQTSVGAQSLQLSWPAASGSFGVQSAPSPAGPWSDTGLTVTSDGSTSSASITNPIPGVFYRLVVQ